MSKRIAAPIAPEGMVGASSASRYVGATTSGAPTSGTFAVGDFIIARDGRIWVCTTAGSPGTWMDAGVGATLILPQSAAPAQTAEGSIVWDSDDNLLTVGDGAGRKTMVDTASAQTLSNKTLTAPVIADLTNGQHDHGDADDGGAIVAAALPAAIGRGVLLRKTIAANSAGVTSETVVTGLTGSIVAGTARLLEFRFSGRVNSTVAGDVIRVRIRNGLTTAGTEIRRGQTAVAVAGGPGQESLDFVVTRVFTGAQDFCVTLERASGTGTVLIAAEATSEAEFVIEDIGVAPA